MNSRHLLARKVNNSCTRTSCEMFKVNNKETRTTTIETLGQGVKCLKLTIKTPERTHWRRYDIFIVNFEHISHLVLAWNPPVHFISEG